MLRDLHSRSTLLIDPEFQSATSSENPVSAKSRVDNGNFRALWPDAGGHQVLFGAYDDASVCSGCVQ